VQLRVLRCDRPAQFDSWVHALYQVAMATIPYLPPADARALWGRLAMTACRDALPDGARWLTLLRALADRDVVTMTNGARDLLENPSPALESRKSRHYLIAVALGGYLAQGKRADARAFWARYGPPLSGSISLELRLLHAHAQGGRPRP
jgi:hypothetical protein